MGDACYVVFFKTEGVEQEVVNSEGDDGEDDGGGSSLR
jgi:hypothetical protein